MRLRPAPYKNAQKLHNPIYPDFDEISTFLAPEEVDDTSLVLLIISDFLVKFHILELLSYLLDAKNNG